MRKVAAGELGKLLNRRLKDIVAPYRCAEEPTAKGAFRYPVRAGIRSRVHVEQLGGWHLSK
jgi:hypothetical protein